MLSSSSEGAIVQAVPIAFAPVKETDRQKEKKTDKKKKKTDKKKKDRQKEKTDKKKKKTK